MLNGLDLFSGIGGLTLALAPWVRPFAYCEADPYCQAVLLSRMADGCLPPAPIWDDVRTLRGDMVAGGGCDIIYGGFPCQDISIAGNGTGLEGERSRLFFEIARLVRDIRPPFVFLENVPAIAFRGLDQVTGVLAACGYDCRWDMLRASDVGADHQRERWWLLANTDSQRLERAGAQSLKESVGEFSSDVTAERGVQGALWLPATSELRRIPDGIRPASHRLRALGNAVVPQCAREAFQRLSGLNL